MAAGQDGVESLVKGLSALNVDGGGVDWVPTEDYYVHIDIIKGASDTAKTAINRHMVEGDAYDPRRATNFPTDLLPEHQKDTLTRRRKAVKVSGQYYEFWKVRKTFSLPKFREMVNEISKTAGPKFEVRIVRIID